METDLFLAMDSSGMLVIKQIFNNNYYTGMLVIKQILNNNYKTGMLVIWQILNNNNKDNMDTTRMLMFETTSVIILVVFFIIYGHGHGFSKCIDHRSAWLMELTKALCLLREGWILTLPTSPGLQAIF